MNTNFPFYVRTLDELVAPFTDNESAVSRAGLRLMYVSEPVMLTTSELLNINSKSTSQRNSIIYYAAYEKNQIKV